MLIIIIIIITTVIIIIIIIIIIIMILDRILTCNMLKTVVCEIEPLINQILITQISDGINYFKCLLSKHSLIDETSSYTPQEVDEKKH